MDKKDLKKVVDSIKKTSPLLLVAGAATDFRKAYKGKITHISNTEEVKDLVAFYSGIKNITGILVIDDLSLLNEQASFMLLKLIEESTFPIILLSSYDKVSPIILSRIKRVVKYGSEKTSSQFLSLTDGQRRINDELSPDSHIYDKYRYMSYYSPLLYRYKNLSGVNREKILFILS